MDRKDYIGKHLKWSEIQKLFPEMWIVMSDCVKEQGVLSEGTIQDICDDNEIADGRLIEYIRNGMRYKRTGIGIGGYLHGRVVDISNSSQAKTVLSECQRFRRKNENEETWLTRNALLLYPYILDQTISHGYAAEILGIKKSELIDIYDKFGYSYLDMIADDLDIELETYHQLKQKDKQCCK
jgi:hypothetical protein